MSSKDLEVEVVYRDQVDVGKAARALLDLVASLDCPGEVDPEATVADRGQRSAKDSMEGPGA